MKEIRYILLWTLLLNSSLVIGQIDSTIVLNRTFQIESEKSDLVGNKIVITQSNEIIVLSEFEYGKSVITKYDFNGEEIWSRQFPQARLNDFKISSSYLLATGYDYWTRKILFSKLSLDGEVIEEKRFKIKYSSEGQSFAIGKDGSIYILSEIEKGRFPIQVSFKNGIRNLLRFVDRKPNNFYNKLAVLKLDLDGNLVWKRIIGMSKSSYYPSDIEVNNHDQICILSHTNSVPNSPDTWIVKLDNNGREIWEETIVGKYIEQCLVSNDDSFQLVGSSSKWKQFENDSIFIFNLDSKNKLSILFQEKTSFDEVTITSFKRDFISNRYYVGGYGVNFKSKGKTWDSHEDNWIGIISLESTSLSEWSFLKKSIDRINDIDLSTKYIVTTGESWGKRKKGDIFQEMRLMIIAK